VEVEVEERVWERKGRLSLRVGRGRSLRVCEGGWTEAEEADAEREE
jgi:hypothetical protein